MTIADRSAKLVTVGLLMIVTNSVILGYDVWLATERGGWYRWGLAGVAMVAQIVTVVYLRLAWRMGRQFR